MTRSVAIVTVFSSTEFPQCPHAHLEGTTEQLKSCRCFRIKYCSPACQKIHWPAHKEICDRALPRFVPDEGAQNHTLTTAVHVLDMSHIQSPASFHPSRSSMQQDWPSATSSALAPLSSP